MLSIPLSATVALGAQSWLAGALCFFSGLLLDLDHLIEYILHCGTKVLNPKHIYQTCQEFAHLKDDSQKLYLIFHSLELVILLWLVFLFSQNIYLLSITLGYTGHMCLDFSANLKRLKPYAYFLSARIKNGFYLSSVLKDR